ncbi:MAG: EamA family transporter [Lachnospiraceae bacterium]|nr:EamA family transporter [Lachnospiraceae bacterium]
MGFLLAIINTLIESVKGYFSKKVSVSTDTLGDVCYINFFRSTFSIVIALLLALLVSGRVPQWFSDPRMLPVVLFSSFMLGAGYCLYFLALRESAFMMTTMFTYLSLFIPIVLGAVFMNEAVHWIQWVGLAVMVVSFYFVSFYSKQVTGKITFKGVLFPILTAISYGSQQFCMTLFHHFEPAMESADYSFFQFLISTGYLLLFAMIFRTVKKKQGQPSALTIEKIVKTSFLPVVIMAGCSCINNYMTVTISGLLPPVIAFPLMKGASLIFSILMSWLLLKEKPNRNCIIGAVICFIALLIINFGPKLVGAA